LLGCSNSDLTLALLTAPTPAAADPPNHPATHLHLLLNLLHPHLASRPPGCCSLLLRPQPLGILPHDHFIKRPLVFCLFSCQLCLFSQLQGALLVDPGHA